MKRFFTDFLQKLGIFFLLNIAVILVYFIIALFFKIPVVDELAARFADAKALDTALYVLYALSYYFFLALLICKNSSARTAYLNVTADEGYSLKRELCQYIREFFLSDIFASTVLSAISFAFIGLFDTNKFVSLIFLPQYSLFSLSGLAFGAIFYAAFTAIFIFAVTMCAQKVWAKNRLSGKA